MMGDVQTSNSSSTYRYVAFERFNHLHILRKNPGLPYSLLNTSDHPVMNFNTVPRRSLLTASNGKIYELPRKVYTRDQIISESYLSNYQYSALFLPKMNMNSLLVHCFSEWLVSSGSDIWFCSWILSSSFFLLLITLTVLFNAINIWTL